MSNGKSHYPHIQIQHVSSKLGDNWVVKAVDFELKNGERLIVMGETGSGKSTLLRMMAGLDQCDEGSISVNGKKILGPEDQLIPGNKGIAYMNQSVALKNNYKIHEILDRHRVLENDEAVKLYESCKVNHLMNRWSDELSGGEKQRVLLASLLVTKPYILLLDEPFSQLDQINKAIIRNVLLWFSAQYNMSIIQATHDPMDMWHWGDVLLVMQNGQVVQYGTPVSLYQKPATEYVAGLLGEYQTIPISILQMMDRNILIDREKNNRLIVRPAFFEIHLSEMPSSLKGTVKNIRVLDNHVLIEVEIAELNLMVSHSLFNQIQPNDFVWVGFRKEFF
jgi:iron(III) transport system ATP-binding protein